MIELFLIIFIVLVLITWYYYSRTKIHFPSENQVFHVIKTSKYLKSFSPNDYRLREVINKKHLLSNYKLYLQYPTHSQKDIITYYCKYADDILYTLKLDNIAKIEWNIILFTKMENEMPHTHKNCILLPLKSIPIERDPLSTRFIITLIHEKMHIFQRNNTNEIKKQTRKLGFRKFKDKLPEYIEAFRRKNPDFDDLYYWKDKYVPLYMLNNDSLTLNDGFFILYDRRSKEIIEDGKIINTYKKYMKKIGITKEYMMEHPYEILSYQLEKKVKPLLYQHDK